MKHVPKRWDMLSRTVAAIGGGYALRGMMLGLLAFAAAVIWVFAARSAGRAWAGLLLPVLPLYLVLVAQRLAWPR